MNSKPKDEWKLNTLIDLKKFTICKIEILLQKIKSDGGVDDDDETSKVDRKSPQLIAFTLSNRKRIMNHLMILLDRIKTNSVYNMDTDSSNIEKLD